MRKITKRHLRRIIEAEAKSTIKYNANPALKGKQTTLPDALQKGIIDSEESDDGNEDDTVDEGKLTITKSQLQKIIKETLEAGQALSIGDTLVSLNDDALINLFKVIFAKGMVDAELFKEFAKEFHNRKIDLSESKTR